MRDALNMAVRPCTKLPEELIALLTNFGEAWAKSTDRPAPAPEALNHWDTLLETWKAAEDLPLFIRKFSNNRGSEIPHESGRLLIPCDNSPAHWVFINSICTDRGQPSIDAIRNVIDKIPIALALNKHENSNATHKVLRKDHNLSRSGWKLAHIDKIGLNDRTPLAQIPIKKLEDHFLKFMSPRNMFVIPSAWAGIAEADEITSAIRSFQQG